MNTFLCVVKSVEGATCTVERVIDDMEIKGVLLSTEIDGSTGIVITPTVESYVLCTRIDSTKWFVCQTSKIEKIALNFSDKIVINDGSNGLAKVDKVADKLNALENKVNELIAGLQATVIPLAPSGSYALSANFGNVQALTATTQADIENDKIMIND